MRDAVHGWCPVTHAYFLNAGIISLLALTREGPVIEAGLVGRDGMFGLPLSLGIAVSQAAALLQGNGSALRIEAAQFRRLLVDCPSLRAKTNLWTDG